MRPFHDTRDALGDLMNGDQALRWNIPPEVMWDSQGGDVFNTLAGDFMKPVIDSGEMLQKKCISHPVSDVWYSETSKI